eukprot:GHVT01066995.1.p1 GENE.GHVT01066995.1~~GHVT01066995.1.p1  ORF type:complete len:106 (-),score=24.78 GHVT01066995.1:739-1056(-)
MIRRLLLLLPLMRLVLRFFTRLLFLSFIVLLHLPLPPLSRLPYFVPLTLFFFTSSPSLSSSSASFFPSSSSSSSCSFFFVHFLLFFFFSLSFIQTCLYSLRKFGL